MDIGTYEVEVGAINMMGLPFAQAVEAIKNARKNWIDGKVAEIMGQLDYSKHDRRNTRKYVENMLRKYYEQNMNGTITPAQWDDTFAVYSPNSGTY